MAFYYLRHFVDMVQSSGEFSGSILFFGGVSRKLVSNTRRKAEG